MKTWGIYARKSKATDKGESIDNQIETAKASIKFNYPSEEVNFEVYIDDGFSGKSMRRPQFVRLMDDAKTGKLSGVIVYRLDRISRNVADFSSIIQRLTKWGVAFISVNEKFDTSTPMGEAMMYIAAVFAQLERQTIAERVRDNMLMLSETGRWLGGRVAYGYESRRSTGNKTAGIKAKSHLVGVSDKLAEVKQLIKLYEDLGSLHAVIKYCSEHELYVNGSTRITDTFLKGVLSNPTYCIADSDAYQFYSDLGARLPAEPADFDGTHGIMPYNRHHGQGDSVTLRDPDEWVLAVGEHEGIIEGARWVRIQKRLMRNKERYDNFSSATNDYALLSGLLFCHACGGRMYTKKQNQKDRKGSANSFFYLCDNHRKYGDKVCTCKSVLGRRIDEAVMQYLQDLAASRETLLKQVSQFKITNRDKERIESDIILLERRKNELITKQSGMFTYLGELVGQGVTGIPPALQKALDDATNQIALLDKEIDEKRQQQSTSKEQNEAWIEFEKFLSGDLQKFFGDTIPARRDIIRQLFSRAEWDPQNEKLLVFPLGELLAPAGSLI